MAPLPIAMAIGAVGRVAPPVPLLEFTPCPPFTCFKLFHLPPTTRVQKIYSFPNQDTIFIKISSTRDANPTKTKTNYNISLKHLCCSCSHILRLYLTMERCKKDFNVCQMVKGSTAVCSICKKIICWGGAWLPFGRDSSFIASDFSIKLNGIG